MQCHWLVMVAQRPSCCHPLHTDPTTPAETSISTLQCKKHDSSLRVFSFNQREFNRARTMLPRLFTTVLGANMRHNIRPGSFRLHRLSTTPNYRQMLGGGTTGKKNGKLWTDIEIHVSIPLIITAVALLGAYVRMTMQREKQNCYKQRADLRARVQELERYATVEAKEELYRIVDTYPKYMSDLILKTLEESVRDERLRDAALRGWTGEVGNEGEDRVYE